MIPYDILAISDSAYSKFLASEKSMLEKLAAMDKDEEEDEKSDILQMHDNIGIVTIKGGLTNSNSWINKYFGLTSYDSIRMASIEALDSGAEAILFHVSSPGGRVGGMSDTANFISSLPVPTVSFTDETMASAAYFLGIQADHVYADSFSEVGSVGVVTVFMDYSEALKKEGITPVRFRSGDLKAAGHPAFKLSAAEKKNFTELIDLYAEKFFQIVSDARGLPRPMLDSMEITSGKVFVGEQAFAAGLVDSILTFDQAVAKTLSLAKKSVDKGSTGKVTYGSY